MAELFQVGDYAAACIRSVLEEVFLERARQLAKWGEQDNPCVHDDGTIGCPTYDQELFNQRGMGIRLRDVMCSADYLKQVNDLATPVGKRTWAGVLAEEVAEAFEEVNQNANTETKIAELIQCAAVCCAWVENLRKRAGTMRTALLFESKPETPDAFAQILQRLDNIEAKLEKPEIKKGGKS